MRRTRPRSARGAQLTDAQDTGRPSADDPGLAPGLGEQVGRTRAAFGRLISAHVELFKAELSEIFGVLKVMATLAGIALLMAMLVLITLYVGGFLFVGEWLFGSIGWGLAHGVLFGLALIVVLGFGIVGIGWRTAVLSFVLAVVLTVGLALLLGSQVLYETAGYFAGQLAAPFDTPASVALIAGAIIVGVALAVAMWRVGGAGGAVFGLILGAVLGLLLGWLLGGIAWEWPPAAGFAITLGLIAWPILHALLAWPQVNLEERFGQLYPRQTIETTTETREWLVNQWQSRRPKPGAK
jgi:MFS family permease